MDINNIPSNYFDKDHSKDSTWAARGGIKADDFKEGMLITILKNKLPLKLNQIPLDFYPPNPEEFNGEDCNPKDNFYENYKEIANQLQKELLRQMKEFKEPAFDLGFHYCLSAEDTITYHSPYEGKSVKEIMQLESGILDHCIQQIQEKCFHTVK